MRKPIAAIKNSLLPSTYAPLLDDLKARGRATQVKVVAPVNRLRFDD